MPTKTILVFCDGTGVDGVLATPKSDGTTSYEADLAPEFDKSSIGELNLAQSPPEGGGSADQFPSNVLRLSRSVKELDAKGCRQLVFYQSGVGSEATFTGDPVAGTGPMQALGTAVASKIRDAYCFIAQNFQDGDEICLFGFSRGAYTTRKLSGLIDRIGLLTRHNLGYFFEIWLQLIAKKSPTIPSDTRHPTIKCVGVWDTVGSVFNQIDALNIDDTSLPKTIEVALHAISIHENRKRFLPTLWSIPNGGLQPNQTLKQVWFGGAHSDVGGGFERHELADISLYWMVGEIESLRVVDLDLDYLKSYAQVKPDPWGTSQPKNSYASASVIQKGILGRETRLQSDQITKNSAFHESVKNSPLKLQSPSYMITMADIKKAFDPGFQPQYPPLNKFEQDCKDKWGTGPPTKPHYGNDNPSILFPPTM